MKSTKIDMKIQKMLSTYVAQYPIIMRIVRAIHDHGGRALLVGGAVRDLLLGIPSKDFDIEVHGLSLEILEKILQNHGPVSLVGKAYGVLRLHGLDVDWSLPRTDTAGRKPQVVIDPAMDIKDAFARRDLTINAMGIDLMSHELVDPFNGLDDLHNKILRAPDPQRFGEDPLRFFRVMQFIGRFDMTPDATLNALCTTMDVSGVSIERIEMEFEKMLLKSKQPSRGIRWIQSLGRLKTLFPELGALVGVPQEPAWHPEGDVFEHTMQTLDAAAFFSYDNSHIKLIIMYAALCHDLGKVSTTATIEGRIQSIGHEQAGVALSKQLLARITHKKDLIESVGVLVKYHLAPVQFVEGNATPTAYKRLARKLAPYATLQMLADLALADAQGRNPHGHEPLKTGRKEIDQFLSRAQQAQVREEPESAVLHGRDLLDSVQPGPAMGRLLDRAYEIQIEEGITDKEELKRRVLQEKKE